MKFWEGVVEAAGKGPLGFAALVVLALSNLADRFFRDNKTAGWQLSALVLLVAALCFVAALGLGGARRAATETSARDLSSEDAPVRGPGGGYEMSPDDMGQRSVIHTRDRVGPHRTKPGMALGIGVMVMFGVILGFSIARLWITAPSFVAVPTDNMGLQFSSGLPELEFDSRFGSRDDQLVPIGLENPTKESVTARITNKSDREVRGGWVQITDGREGQQIGYLIIRKVVRPGRSVLLGPISIPRITQNTDPNNRTIYLYPSD